jgi:uncharacterized protein
MEAYFNLSLLVGVLAIFLAQALKIPIAYIQTKKWDVQLLFSTGSMPSSHSAGVMAVATSVGLETGFNSPIFAVSAMLAGIVMYDATGIRFHAGQQANALILIREDLKTYFHEIKRPTKQHEIELKTSLGHKRIEVLGGGLFGALFVFIVYALK